MKTFKEFNESNLDLICRYIHSYGNIIIDKFDQPIGKIKYLYNVSQCTITSHQFREDMLNLNMHIMRSSPNVLTFSLGKDDYVQVRGLVNRGYINQIVITNYNG